MLACSCDAFGLPVPGGVPADVVDIGVEVRAHPDQFSPEPAAGAAASLLVGGAAIPWAEVQRPPDRPPVARLWVDEDTAEAVLLHAVAVEPLLGLGSVVLGTGLTPEQAARVRAVEAVTGRAGM